MNNSDLFNSNFRDLIEEFSQDVVKLRDNYQFFQSIKNSILNIKSGDQEDVQQFTQESHDICENKVVPLINPNQEDKNSLIVDKLQQEYQNELNELTQNNAALHDQLTESNTFNNKLQERIKELENNLHQIQQVSEINKQKHDVDITGFISNIEELTKANQTQSCLIDQKNLQIQLLETTVQELQTIVDQNAQTVIKKNLTQSLYQSPQVDPELMNKVYTPASVSSYRSDQVPKTPDERKKLFRDLNRNATLSASMMSVKHDYTTLQQIIRSNDNLSTRSDKSDS